MFIKSNSRPAQIHDRVLQCCLLAVTLYGSILPAVAQDATEDTAPVVPAAIPSVTPAEAERLVGGVPRINIDVKDTPLAEVLEQFRQQSGLNLQFRMTYLRVDPKTLVTFEAKDRPLWEAVRAFEEKIGGQVVLVEDGVMYNGIFAGEKLLAEGIRTPLYFLAPGSINHERKATYMYTTDDTTSSEEFTFSGGVRMDPRLHRFAGSNVHIDEIVDDKGGSLATEAKDFPNPFAMQNALFFKVGLKSTPDMGRSIARMKGTVSTLVAVKTEAWEIPDAPHAAGASKTFHTKLGDITYSLASIHTSNIDDSLAFTFSMSGPMFNVLGGYNRPLLGSIITAFNADGKIITSAGGNDREFRYRIREEQGTPAKFVLTVPVEIRNLEIPFELKNLPLPPVEPVAPKTAVAVAPDPRDAVPALSIDEALRRAGKESLITLQFKETRADKVVAELSRQSGVPVLFSPYEEHSVTIPTISIDVQQQPFWAALRAVIAACRLRFLYEGRGNTIELISDPGGTRAAAQWQRPIGAAGLVFVTATHATAEQHSSIRFVTKEVYVSRPLTVFCEGAMAPQVSGIPYTGRLRVDAALDDKGQSLMPEVTGYRSDAWEEAAVKFGQKIVLKSREGSRRIASLKATLRLGGATRQEAWEIPNIAEAQQLQRTVKVVHGEETYEQTYTLDGFSMNEQEFRFNIHIATNPAEARTPTQIREMLQWFRFHTRLSDGAGYVWPGFHFQVIDTRQGSYLTLVFPRIFHEHNPGPPVKLVLDVPLEIQQVEVPIEFKDLPLP